MIQELHKFLEAPTEENVCKTLKEDTYGRMEKVCQFADMIAGADDNYVIALDGRWGSGKTFFVKEVQKVLEAAAADEEIELTPRCADQFASLKNKQHLVTLYYDAWEHDTDDKPLLSIIYELMSDERINHCFIDDEKVLASLETMIKAIIRLISPDRAKAIEGLIDFFKGASGTVNAVQSAHEKQDDLNTCLPKLFEQLLKTTGRKRIVFFIDELDRCRPDFAVRLLESMKHYFTSPDVIFVLSINREQLCHTIRKYYGAEFDARLYLNKFFDNIYTLERVSPSGFRRGMNYEYRSAYNGNLVDGVAAYYRMELREQKLYRGALYTHPEVNGFENDFCQEIMTAKTLPPILMGMAISDYKACIQSFMGEDEGCNKFLEVVHSIQSINLDYLFKEILPYNKTFHTDIRGGGRPLAGFDEAFIKFYKSTFGYKRLTIEQKATIKEMFVEEYQRDKQYLIGLVSDL